MLLRRYERQKIGFFGAGSGVNSFTDDCFAEGRELEIVPGLRIENWVEWKSGYKL